MAIPIVPAASLPALAKNARTGHPRFQNGKGKPGGVGHPSDMSGGLVIYLSGDRRINVGQYTEGRPQLKAFITEHAQGGTASS